MNENLDRKPPNAQKNYRASQVGKGLVRYELQIPKQAKERFEAAAMAIADQYSHPFDLRRRLAKARTEVFNQLTQGVTQEFYQLKEQIQTLKNEISALSPSFFKSDASERAPLPEAIAALEDNPKRLKQILAKTYKESQQAKHDLQKTTSWTARYQKLYEASEEFNEQLKKRLEQYENPPVDDN